MRRSDVVGGGCEDDKGSATFDGEARLGAESTARHTSDSARSAESAVRELNGALAEADLSFEMFAGVDWSVFSGASACLKALSMSDGARWCQKFASRHLQRAGDESAASQSGGPSSSLPSCSHSSGIWKARSPRGKQRKVRPSMDSFVSGWATSSCLRSPTCISAPVVGIHSFSSGR